MYKKPFENITYFSGGKTFLFKITFFHLLDNIKDNKNYR